MTVARNLAAAVLFVVIGIGAAACEFGEHRGSHSNVYPDDAPNAQRPAQPAQPDY
jgi:hypothetical protein